MRYLHRLRKRGQSQTETIPGDVETKLAEAERTIEDQRELIELLLSTWNTKGGLYIPPGN